MSQRNPQTSIKTGGGFGNKTGKISNISNSPSGKPQKPAVLCPACKTEVPQKTGFRLSSLKCPKCGATMSGK